jgi:hypothetical protein
MNARKILLLSVALNALFTVVLVLQTSLANRREPRVPRPVHVTSTVNEERTLPLAPVPAAPPALPELPPLPPGFDWSRMEAVDLADYVKNLKAVGCPAETIYDIIRGAHGRQVIAAMEKVFAPLTADFWGLASKGKKGLEKEFEESVRQLERKQKAEWEKLEALIGFKPSPVRDANATLAKRVNFLPPEKQKLFADLNAKFDEMMREANPPADGKERPDRDEKRVQEKLAEIRKQRSDAIRDLMTPAEFAEYEMRGSRNSRWAEGVLGFEPKPEEFASITRLKAKLDERFAIKTNDKQAAKEIAATRAAEEALQIAAVLGPARFEEYQRGLDEGYKAAMRVTVFYDLPPERAAQVYEIKRSADEYLATLNANTDLSPEDRVAALGAARQGILDGIEKILGPQAAKLYRNNNGGWLSKFPAASAP